MLVEPLTGKKLWTTQPVGPEPPVTGPHQLSMQEDGDLVFYGSDVSGGGLRALWRSSTATDRANMRAVVVRVQNDGCLALYDAQGIVRWSSKPTDYVWRDDYLRGEHLRRQRQVPEE